MTPLRTIFLTLTLVTLVSADPSRAANDPSCTIPPSGAMSTGTGSNGTFDTIYRPMWAYSQDAIDDFWYGLECEAGDWDEGWGYSAPTNLNYTLARLFNGAQVVWMVRQYAKHQGFGLWRPVTGIPAGNFDKGLYWDFVAGWGADEWTPGCSTSLNGQHVVDPDEYNVLHLNGAYFIPAISRASTLVHETTHQDIPHEPAESCNPDNVSCDGWYGLYNSNTMQINFLHDAELAFELTQVNGQVVHQVARSGNDCGWIPKFALDERIAASSRASAVMNRFANDSWSGWKQSLLNEVAARKDESTWDCPWCDPSQWNFDPNECHQTACNELLNVQNIGINNHNQQVCQDYNAAVVQPGADEDTVAAAQNQKLIATYQCQPPNPGLARAYCDAEKQSADQWATQVDHCGWLDDVYSESVSHFDCVQEWCHEKFEESGGGWGTTQGDFQCFAYICGENFGCGTAATEEECEEWLVVVHADPALYVAPCEWNKCKERKVSCLKEHHAAGTWTYGDPIPGECAFAEQICEMAARLALEAFIDRRPFIDPGPYRDRIEGIHTRNPGKNVYAFADAIRRAADAGRDAATLNRMAVKLTSSPEMISALYHASPKEFVGLYGSEGFLEVLGPDVASVTPQRLVPETPRGQAALADLERLVAEAGGVLEGAIGTFRQ